MLDRPIVVFGDDWGRHVSSMQHLFRHIAVDHDVVWVNAISHRVPHLSVADIARAAGKVRSLVQGGRAGVEGEVAIGALPRAIVHPSVLPWHHLRLVRAFNRRSLIRAIRRALSAIGATRPPLVVTGSPPSVSVLGDLGEVASVYYCMDDFLHLPDVTAWMIEPLERELLQRVDALVATAQALVTSKQPRTGVAHYLPQGVNFEHFATPQPVPRDLAALPRPIVGFAGGLTTPVDLTLLKRLSAEISGGSIVLVGPVRVDLSSIAGANVHVLGPRPYRELPGYVQAFDVGLIPYVLNQHTVAVDPLKLLEYLAAGVPVVTTDLPEVRKYRDAVRIGATHDEFIAAVHATLANPGSPQERRQVARQHGWDRRAATLLEILASVAATRPATGASAR